MALSGLFSFWAPLFFSYSLFLRFLLAASDDDDGRKTPPPFPLPRPPLSPPSSSQNRATLTPFRPSIAVIVGVLTTMFSVTFLLLMYAKHCKRAHATGNYIGGNRNNHHLSSTSGAGAAARRNSGIDRSVIESLPIFRFSSLRGQKEGLECAVCLTLFEPTEILRLLPKCKHAFHVECVDTWLDAHSTCPLCRYRVDPEDVLLIEDTKLLTISGNSNNNEKDDLPSHRCSESVALDRTSRNSTELVVPETSSGGGFSRKILSGRHSSAGERTSQFLQILVQRPSDSVSSSSSSSFWASRRSLDSASSRKKRETTTTTTTAQQAGVTVGCFERSSGRKDGLLLSSDTDAAADDKEKDEKFMRRFEHRIILSRDNSTNSSNVGVGGGYDRRWSDLRPSDLLFLQSELIISNSGRYSLSASEPSAKRGQEQERHQEQGNRGRGGGEDKIDVSGRSVINSRCMSEITGLGRFSNRTDGAVGT